jgi:hypothetical protein
MYHYRLHYEDGSDAGQATYAVPINPGELIHIGVGKTFRVIDLVDTWDDSEKYVGLLRVEAA